MLVSKRRKSSPVEHIEANSADAERLAELGQALRDKYADIKDEPIPERLRQLVDAMRAIDTKDKGAG